MNLPSTHHAGPRFQLGQILATSAALEALGTTGVSIINLLIRHSNPPLDRRDVGSINVSLKGEGFLRLVDLVPALLDALVKQSRSELVRPEGCRSAWQSCGAGCTAED